jgi:hypothetical protein
MRTLAFAADNPDAALWFTLLYQAVANATPGPRDFWFHTVEASLIQKLDAISDPTGKPHQNGYQPRTLREPCTITITPDEWQIAQHYIIKAGYQPFLSQRMIDLLRHFEHAPTVTQEMNAI